MSLLYFFINLN